MEEIKTTEKWKSNDVDKEILIENMITAYTTSLEKFKKDGKIENYIIEQDYEVFRLKVKSDLNEEELAKLFGDIEVDWHMFRKIEDCNDEEFEKQMGL